MTTRPFQLPPIERLHWLSAGYCTHHEWVTMRGGVFQAVQFPAGFACIEHPHAGLILFDTGYSERFAKETSHFPTSIYGRLTPVYFQKEQSASSQLRQLGYAPQDVAIIMISHFHGDHIAGLRDFPNTQFIYAAEAYEAVYRKRGLAAVKAGYLPGLLPDDFEKRSRPFRLQPLSASATKHSFPVSALSAPSLAIPTEAVRYTALPNGSPFPVGYDILGDGSLVAIDLPGHAAGQIGLFLSTTEQDYLLCADAAWSSRAIRDNLPPHPLAGIIMSNRKGYADSFAKLVELHQRFPSLCIMPTHCLEHQKVSY
ncbi:MBL fold metallo-hydrolase [Paenibacillus agricola]|uniref:MBL fold metallo-hydrolase n=1 Tax=Paenibacillus agricola TaxID=2716264 RepID=UPI0028933508|nr:MBL fold metallo-hydrolase [Paenibacillus agricola]